MTACAVGTGESEQNWLTRILRLETPVSGYEVSHPALRLPSQPIHQHQNNELSPSYAYFETLCRNGDD